MSLLAGMLRKRWRLVLTAACASCLAAAVTMWWNVQLSGIINTVSAGGALSVDVIALALAAMLGMGAAAYAKGYMAGLAGESMAHDLRMGYARYFAALPFAEIERRNAGEQLSGLQNEIADVSGYLNASLFQLFDDCVRFIVTLVWLIVLHPALALAVNAPVLAIMAYVVYASKTISVAVERSQQAKGRMNGHADTLLTLFPVVRLYDAARMVRRAYRREVGAWERQTVRAERTRARLMSLSALLSSLPLMLLFMTGGAMTIRGTLTVGTLYIFLNLSGNVSGVMMNMPGYVGAFRQFTANMRRLMPHVLLGEREE